MGGLDVKKKNVIISFTSVHTLLQCINYTHWRWPFKCWNTLHLRIVLIKWWFNDTWMHLSIGRHCATSRKVAGSIPDDVIGIFYWHKPSGRTVGPGVDTASNRNEYQEFFLGGKGGRCLGLTTLTLCLEIWELQPPGPVQACNGIALPLPLRLWMCIWYSHVFIHQLKRTVATLPTAWENTVSAFC